MWQRARRWAGVQGRGDAAKDQLALTSGNVAFAVLLVITSALLLAQLVFAFIHLPDTLGLHQRCRMSRMWPSYVRHQPPSNSGLGAKYSLYLYRELPPGGRQDPPTGRPALFVPGNAGSYGQVRSVASSSHHLYELGEGENGTNGLEVDWWTVDFNEDFSAFHADTLREQARYLNEVITYLRQVYDNSSTVTVLAHSMGGIAARLMVLQDEHPAESVKTLITLSSPHAYPPVPLDGGLEQVYAEIERSAQSALSTQLLLISLSGGILDDQLSSEGSVLSLARLWRPETSLHAFTAGMAALWSGVDHLAMMWCDQLRTRIARGILRIEEDARQTIAERRQRWQKMLGISFRDEKELPEFFFSEPFDAADQEEDRLEDHRSQYDVPQFTNDYEAFELFTTAAVGIDTSFGPPIEHEADIKIDLCDASHVCRSVSPAAFDVLPPSTSETAGHFPLAEAQYELPGMSIRKLEIAMDFLRDKKIEKIIVHSKGLSGSTTQAGFRSPTTEYWHYSIPRPPTSFTAEFQPHDSKQIRSASQSALIHGMHSTMFVYNVRVNPSKVKVKDCDDSRAMPVLRVTSLPTGDVQYYPAVRAGSSHKLMLHGSSPYMLPTANVSQQAFEFTLMVDQCRSIGGVEASIDFKASAGLLISRYRTVVVALPTSIMIFVSTIMWINWDAGTAFPDTLTALIASARAAIPSLVALSWLGSALQRIAYLYFGQDTMTTIVNLTFGMPTVPFAYSAILAVLFTLSSYGMTVAVTACLDGTVFCLASVLRKVGVKYKTADSPNPSRISTVATLTLAIAIGIGVLVAVPVHFVYLVVVMVQLVSCICCELIDGRGLQHNLNASRQYRLLLHLMVWLLPLKAPILLIWSRNLLNGWYGTLGRSDHNIFAILGFLLVTYISTTGQSIPRARTRTTKTITVLILLRCLVTAVLYGVRYTYTLTGTINVLLVWLSFLYFRDRVYQAIPRRTEGDDTTEHQEVEKRLLLASNDPHGVETLPHARYSNLPGESMIASEAVLPDTIRASMHAKAEGRAEAYHISDRNVEDDDTITTTKDQSELDKLLEEYLHALDKYMITRQSISDTVARGIFQLSKARMQLGLPHMHEGWDARMQASNRVEIRPDGSIALTKAKNELVASTFKSVEVEGNTLRQRKKTLTEEKEDVKDEILEGDLKKEKVSKAEARPYDPLFQFSALPPQTLRHSKASFEKVVKLIAGPPDGSKEELGLLNEMRRIQELELRIGKLRAASSSSSS